MVSKLYSILKRVNSDRPYLASIAILYFLVLIKYTPFGLGGNESVYLIDSKRLIDPLFLVNDWSFQCSPYTENLKLLFDILIAPFWLLQDPVLVGFTVRLLVWTILLYSFYRLSRAIELKWYSFLFGSIFWLYNGQSLVAGGWVFGGAESKCVAYGMLFLSMTFLLNDRALMGGIFNGLAICFHVIVGGWGAVANALALLVVSKKKQDLKQVFIFCLICIAVSIPNLTVALKYVFQKNNIVPNVPNIQNKIDSLSVIFRNPHHLNPDVFMTFDSWVFLFVNLVVGCFFVSRLLLKKYNAKFESSWSVGWVSSIVACLAAASVLFLFLKLDANMLSFVDFWRNLNPAYLLRHRNIVLIELLFVLTLLGIYSSLPMRKAIYLIGFLSSLCFIFAIGIICKKYGLLWYLKFYPFRLFPVFLLLLFFLLSINYSVGFSRSVAGRIQLDFKKNKLALVFLVVLSFTFNFTPSIFEDIYVFLNKVRYNIAYHKDKKMMAYRWIKLNTAPDATFLAPPNCFDFWVFAERRLIVNFKFCPANSTILEWFDRLKALNGGKDLKNKGFALNSEIEKNYNKLSISHLIYLKKKYGSKYYLLSEERSDLADYKVFDNKKYFIYKL